MMARSVERDKSRGEEIKSHCGAQDAPEIPDDAEREETAGDRDGDKDAGDFGVGGFQGEIDSAANQVLMFKDRGWDFVHGARSLATSAMAGTLFVALEFFDPEGSRPERVAVVFSGYFSGVLVFAGLHRWEHARHRASLPVDRMGGSRMGLIVLAIVFATAGGNGTAGLAVWVAFSSLILGCMADGAWIALVAKRRGIGLWWAWWGLIRGEREARRQCWKALFGGSGR